MYRCVYVLINGPTEHTDKLVDEAMAPFDETSQVRPYIIQLNRGATRSIADHYKVGEKNLAALKPKLQDWFGMPGGINKLGLYLDSTRNPNGQWNCYEIGGRWNGFLYGRLPSHRPRMNSKLSLNSISVADFLHSGKLRQRLPYAIVTPCGAWFSRKVDIDVSFGWFSWELPSAEWAKRVRRVLRAFPNHRIVCVEAHS